MKTSSALAVSFVSLFCLTLFLAPCAGAREMVLPAGTLLQCTLNEPNFSSATASVGDPVLCHLRTITEFGQQVFPRGSYLVGHLESAQDPGHLWGKGSMKLQFDRIGLPNGDLPLDAKVVSTRGYKVDKDGDIRGKGHAKRDIVEWMIPPLWPWKIIMLPARGPRPALKGESVLTLRLMDDVEIAQGPTTFGPDWHFFGRPQSEARQDGDAYMGSLNQAPLGSSLRDTSLSAEPRLLLRDAPVSSEPRVEEVPAATYASYAQARPGPAASLVATDARFTGTAPGVPVFVLKTGMVLAVGNYTYQQGRISYELASGGYGVVGTDEVDWTTTTQVNLQRGVRVTLHGGHPQNSAAGF